MQIKHVKNSYLNYFRYGRGNYRLVSVQRYGMIAVNDFEYTVNEAKLLRDALDMAIKEVEDAK